MECKPGSRFSKLACGAVQEAIGRLCGLVGSETPRITLKSSSVTTCRASCYDVWDKSWCHTCAACKYETFSEPARVAAAGI